MPRKRSDGVIQSISLGCAANHLNLVDSGSTVVCYRCHSMCVHLAINSMW